MISENDIAVFTGNANPKLAEAICRDLGVPAGRAIVDRFPEGEIQVQILDNIRGKDVFLIQSTCAPSNDSLMELLIMMDAVKRASAKRITAVLPYFGYARQDRKDKPRVPITAKLIANLLVQSGASRVLTMDLHAGQIQGFFDIPVDHLYAITVLSSYFVDKKIKREPLRLISTEKRKTKRVLVIKCPWGSIQLWLPRLSLKGELPPEREPYC